MLAQHPKPAGHGHSTCQGPAGKGGGQQPNTQALMEGLASHLTEKAKGRDPARAPVRRTQTQASTSTSPSLSPSPKVWSCQSWKPRQRGSCTPRGEAPPQMRLPPRAGQGSRGCRPVQGRRLTPRTDPGAPPIPCSLPAPRPGWRPSHGLKDTGGSLSAPLQAPFQGFVRTDSSHDAQGDCVTREMDSCVALQPHAPGERHRAGKKGSVLRKAELLPLLVSSC